MFLFCAVLKIKIFRTALLKILRNQRKPFSQRWYLLSAGALYLLGRDKFSAKTISINNFSSERVDSIRACMGDEGSG